LADGPAGPKVHGPLSYRMVHVGVTSAGFPSDVCSARFMCRYFEWILGWV